MFFLLFFFIDYCSPNKFLNFWGAILPCFAVAPLGGERNGIKLLLMCLHSVLS